MIFHDFLGDIESKSGATSALAGREIRLKNLWHLRGGDSATVILHADVHVEIFTSATDRDDALVVGTRLHGIDDDILNRALDLDYVTHDDSALTQGALYFHAALRRD